MSGARRSLWIAVLVGAACGGGGGLSETTGASASTSDTGGMSSSGAEATGSTATTGGHTGEPTSAGPTGDPGSAGPTGDPTGGSSGDPTASGSDTSGGPTTDSSGSTGGGQQCDGEVHQGNATYYAADGSGNCSFDADPGDPMVAAMNHADYMASAACGACVQIDGPDGQITVRIVDRCPECPVGHIDLGEAAFTMIAAKELGIVPITWRYVSCDVQGPIVYHFKEGSNEWWTAVQIRDHRNAIAALAFKDAADQWQDVPRLDYNYFVADQGMGPGPYAFRVTDALGHVLEDSGIPFVEAGDSPGAEQFPACVP